MLGKHLFKRYVWVIFIVALACGMTALLLGAPIRTVEATITKVSDGDTVQTTTPEGTKLRVRLYGIDATETGRKNKKTGRISKLGQPYGAEAQNYLVRMALNRKSRIDIIDIDRHK